MTDYHPFGWEMPGRKYNSSEYRYGFNGKEKDDEGEFGSITNYDYGFRIYNPGIGRFLSVDPLTKTYPFYTPYQFAANSPIGSIDLDGLESLFKHQPKVEYKPVFKNGPSSILEKANNAGHNFMAIGGNTIVDAENTLRGVWNFGVNLYTGKYNGSNGTEVLVKMDHAFSEGVDRVFDYHTTTPLKNQLVDAFDTATDPKSIEFSFQLYLFGGKQVLDDVAKKAGSVGLVINSTELSYTRARAIELQQGLKASDLPKQASGNATVAVGISENGQVYVSMNTNAILDERVVAVMQTLLKDGEKLIADAVGKRGPKAPHAERNMMAHSVRSGEKIVEMDTGTNMCVPCKELLKSNNVKTTTPVQSPKPKKDSNQGDLFDTIDP